MEQANQAAGSDSVRGGEAGLTPRDRELVELAARTVAAEIAGRMAAFRTERALFEFEKSKSDIATRWGDPSFAKAEVARIRAKAGLDSDGFVPLSDQPATAPTPSEIAEQIGQNAAKLADPRFLAVGVRLVDFLKATCKHFACWRCIDPSMVYAGGDSTWSWKQEAEDLKAKLDALPVELDSPILTDRDGGEAIAVTGQGTSRVVYRGKTGSGQITSETPTQSQRPLGNQIDTTA